MEYQEECMREIVNTLICDEKYHIFLSSGVSKSKLIDAFLENLVESGNFGDADDYIIDQIKKYKEGLSDDESEN